MYGINVSVKVNMNVKQLKEQISKKDQMIGFLKARALMFKYQFLSNYDKLQLDEYLKKHYEELYEAKHEN